MPPKLAISNRNIILKEAFQATQETLSNAADIKQKTLPAILCSAQQEVLTHPGFTFLQLCLFQH